MNKKLLIGKCFTKKNPSEAGGVIVLFEKLKEDFESHQIKYDLVDINYRNYSNYKIISYPLILLQIFKNIIYKNVVMLNIDDNGLINYAPFILFFRKVLSYKVYIRMFGGSLDRKYDKSSFFTKKIIKYSIKNCDKIFYEPKYLIKRFLSFNNNSYWFPNVRDNSSFKTSKFFNKKFIYLGLVREEKGVNLILNVFKNILDYKIDIYGPLINNYEPPLKDKDFFDNSYKGAIESKHVTKILSEYDVLVLPTHWKGEGFPGVIIEAMSVGLPIIATNLPGISEMVDENCSILFDPKDLNAFKKAVVSINNKNYLSLHEAALKQFKNFDSNFVMKNIINIIME